MKKLFNFLFRISVEKSKTNNQPEEEISYSRDELKKVLNRLYKCRDLEISNLWQRSVFLSVFMVLCFTGYGYLLTQIIDSITSTNFIVEMKLVYLHVVAITLGGINFVFSLLWIMMAKGSKAWYEVYEVAISAFSYKHYREIGLPENNIMGEMGVPFSKLDNHILSCKAGAYSVSKINVVIGQLCLCLWALIATIHLFFLFAVNFEWEYNIVYYIVFSILFLILMVLVAGYIRKKCISGHLYDTIYGDKGEPLCKRK